MPLLFSLVFNDLSVWWLIPCVGLGFLYAWLFYQKSVIENRALKNSLFIMRSVTVGLLAILLLSPLIKTVKQRLQKPLIFIAQDASASVALLQKTGFDSIAYHQNLQHLAKKLSDDYEVKLLNFSDQAKAGFNFEQSGKQTDISSVLDFIDGQSPDQNIGALILATDGIYNKGKDPITQISDKRFPIYTVALGDTISKRDLVLMPPTYNQLVYLGNSHEVEISAKAFGVKGVATTLKVSTNDGQLKQQQVSFGKDDETKTFKFTLDAKKKGIQKITLYLTPIANEVSTENNKQTIYVEVLDGREKVLLIADAPHPDISALKQAISTNKNYEVNVAFADDFPATITDYGLIILHNLPSTTHNIGAFLNSIKQKSKWFIIGTQTDINTLNKQQSVLEISGGNQTQAYSSILNPDFYAFTLSAGTQSNLQSLAPIFAPFANYKLKSAGKTLLKQQIGNVETEASLLVFDDAGATKTAILTGEGIWRWRMEDFERNNNTEAFDELINKSVQYLSAKEDRRKFRVQSNESRYLENEAVLLNGELYNDAYELVNEPEVSLELKSAEGKKYSYVFSRVGNAYELNTGFLPVGAYDFVAKTKLGSMSYTAKGGFLVEALNVELMESRANHQLLYNISETTGGIMVYPEDMMSLIEKIKTNEKVKTISYQEKNYDPLINLNWIFALIIILLSFEWFLRKRNGAV
ncbi:hypothetical protein [Pedobacter arcticus]|uniref:hypothetical protein n=1 Tax=Pedobacter arcticus TaxID=752140 RepID=UPI0002DEB4E9|nr:hypothetical protein [Pedobacter arcticus]